METAGLGTLRDTQCEAVAVQLEALKVLSNLIHQSTVVQTYCCQNGLLPKLFNRIEAHNEEKCVSSQLRVFELRLVFLLTALCPEQRDIARQNYRGVGVLCAALQGIIFAADKGEGALAEAECELLSEVLKVTFSLTVSVGDSEEAQLIELALALNRLCRLGYRSSLWQEKVVSHCINVVTNMEGRLGPLERLLRGPQLQQTAEPDVLFMGATVNTLKSFLSLLTKRLTTSSNLKEDITPLLSVLYNMAKAIRPARYTTIRH